MKIKVDELRDYKICGGGVYFILSNDTPVYIGCSREFKTRVTEARFFKEFLLNGITDIIFFSIEDEKEAFNLEKQLIHLFYPIKNITAGKQSKRSVYSTRKRRMASAIF